MFQLTEFVEARLATLTSRVEKHGDDDKPAVSLGLVVECANTILDAIDPTLRLAMFKPKDPSAPELPEIEQTTPVLRCNSIERVLLPTKYEGWTLAVDASADEANAALFGGCKVDKFSVEPRQGGSITLRLRVGTSDLTAERSGMLGMHVGQSVWIKLLPPKKGAEAPAAGAQQRDLLGGPDADDDDDADDAANEGGTPDLTPEAALARSLVAGAQSSSRKPKAAGGAS